MRHELSVDINYIRICRIGIVTDPCLPRPHSKSSGKQFLQIFLNQNSLYVHTIKSVFFPIFTRLWQSIKVRSCKSVYLLQSYKSVNQAVVFPQYCKSQIVTLYIVLHIMYQAIQYEIISFHKPPLAAIDFFAVLVYDLSPVVFCVLRDR